MQRFGSALKVLGLLLILLPAVGCGVVWMHFYGGPPDGAAVIFVATVFAVCAAFAGIVLLLIAYAITG
jgi:hypothetical protein